MPLVALQVRGFRGFRMLISLVGPSTQEPRYLKSSFSSNLVPLLVTSGGCSSMLYTRYCVLFPFSPSSTLLHSVSTLRRTSWACMISLKKRGISSAKARFASLTFGCLLDLRGVILNPVCHCFFSWHSYTVKMISLGSFRHIKVIIKYILKHSVNKDHKCTTGNHIIKTNKYL